MRPKCEVSLRTGNKESLSFPRKRESSGNTGSPLKLAPECLNRGACGDDKLKKKFLEGPCILLSIAVIGFLGIFIWGTGCKVKDVNSGSFNKGQSEAGLPKSGGGFRDGGKAGLPPSGNKFRDSDDKGLSSSDSGFSDGKKGMPPSKKFEDPKQPGLTKKPPKEKKKDQGVGLPPKNP